MNQRIISGKTILLNTVTNCTFLASKLDEKTQLKQSNVDHIEIAGELNIAVEVKEGTHYSNTDIAGEFQKKLTSLINQYSKENDSNTPDFILAQFLNDSLEAWNKSVMRRSDWYGNVDRIGASIDL